MNAHEKLTNERDALRIALREAEQTIEALQQIGRGREAELEARMAELGHNPVNLAGERMFPGTRVKWSRRSDGLAVRTPVDELHPDEESGIPPTDYRKAFGEARRSADGKDRDNGDNESREDLCKLEERAMPGLCIELTPGSDEPTKVRKIFNGRYIYHEEIVDALMARGELIIRREARVAELEAQEADDDPEFQAMSRILNEVREALECDDMAHPASEVHKLKARVAELVESEEKAWQTVAKLRVELETTHRLRKERDQWRTHSESTLNRLQAEHAARVAEIGRGRDSKLFDLEYRETLSIRLRNRIIFAACLRDDISDDDMVKTIARLASPDGKERGGAI